jgi:YebC/PmpR family DNA-binding regulatory protein
MSGHSKWSTIKHKKAAADAKRGKVFTRLAKEITVAAREGGGDTDVNVRLRLIVEKAKAANMPKDNIERAIKRGTGELEGGELYEILYEAYGPHGIGFVIETVTDNKNRVVAELRHVLNKYGGSMADAGSVIWQFTRKGYLEVGGEYDPDELFLVAADAGAEDIRTDDGSSEIYTGLETLQSVRAALEENGFALEDVSVYYEANNPIELEENQAVQVLKLVELLEELDDVQDVYTALDVSDEALEALEVA